MKLFLLVLLATALAVATARELTGAPAVATAKAVSTSTASAHATAVAHATGYDDSSDVDGVFDGHYVIAHPFPLVSDDSASESDDEEEKVPHPGCFFKPSYKCEPDLCGDAPCQYPNKCATVKKIVEEEVTVDAPCVWPKLACKEISKECGDDLSCKYDETCESEEVCEKVAYQYGPYYKLVCKDVYSCEKIDPTVCKTIEHNVCIARDPKVHGPGFFHGYEMAWYHDWHIGLPCGDSYCPYGSACATCEVEVCHDVVIEKPAAQCGYDAAAKVPTFCPEGSMCVELCPQITKIVKKVVEEAVCVPTYNPWYAKAPEPIACGYEKCAPGYKCTEETCELCPLYIPLPSSDVDEDEEAPAYPYPYHPYGHGYPYPVGADVATTAEDPVAYPPVYGYHGYYEPKPVVDSAAEDPKYKVLHYLPKPDVASVEAEKPKPTFVHWLPKPDVAAVEAEKPKPTFVHWLPKPDVAAVEAEKPKPTIVHWLPKEEKPVDVKPVDVKPVELKPAATVDSTAAEKPKSEPKVEVYGSSHTSGNGKASYDATADIPAEDGTTGLHADVWGASHLKDGEPYANVKCNTETVIDGVALCDGVAKHDDPEAKPDTAKAAP